MTPFSEWSCILTTINSIHRSEIAVLPSRTKIDNIPFVLHHCCLVETGTHLALGAGASLPVHSKSCSTSAAAWPMMETYVRRKLVRKGFPRRRKLMSLPGSSSQQQQQRPWFFPYLLASCAMGLFAAFGALGCYSFRFLKMFRIRGVLRGAQLRQGFISQICPSVIIIKLIDFFSQNLCFRNMQ